MYDYEKWSDEALRQEAEEDLARRIPGADTAQLSAQLSREELVAWLRKKRSDRQSHIDLAVLAVVNAVTICALGWDTRTWIWIPLLFVVLFNVGVAVTLFFWK